MQVFKRTYRYKATSTTKQSTKWHVEWFDQRNQLTRRTPGYSDKTATAELGRKLAQLSAMAAQNMQPDGDRRRWIETLPAKLLHMLVDYQLIERQSAAAAKTLAEHVQDYHESQQSAGVTRKQADQNRFRITAIFDDAKARYWSDLTVSRVQNAIGAIQHNGDPLKTRTRNHYLTAVNAFCNWMVNGPQGLIFASGWRLTAGGDG